MISKSATRPAGTRKLSNSNIAQDLLQGVSAVSPNNSYTSRQKTSDYDAVIICLGEFDAFGMPKQHVTERLVEGLSLAVKHAVPYLVLSGGVKGVAAYGKPGATEAGQAYRYIRRSVPSKITVLLETSALCSIGNILFSVVSIAQPKAWRRLLIVTSDFHLDRVKQIADTVCRGIVDAHVVGATTCDERIRKSRITSELRQNHFIDRFYNSVTPGDLPGAFRWVQQNHESHYYSGLTLHEIARTVEPAKRHRKTDRIDSPQLSLWHEDTDSMPISREERTSFSNLRVDLL